MKLGDRVLTRKWGWGTVVGFEVVGFTRIRISSTQSQTDPLQRIIVALDDRNQWILSSHAQPHPHMMPSDFVTPVFEDQHAGGVA